MISLINLVDKPETHQSTDSSHCYSFTVFIQILSKNYFIRFYICTLLNYVKNWRTSLISTQTFCRTVQRTFQSGLMNGAVISKSGIF
jgi:hypothetical protein